MMNMYDTEQQLSTALTAWQQAGLIDARTATAILAYEQQQAQTAPSRHSADRNTHVAPRHSLAVILFAVIAAALIGLGIIALFAANWDEFSPPARTVVALCPLFVAQLLVWRYLKTQRQGRPLPIWREATALFWLLSIGAAMALIGQTYQVPANMALFLKAWWWLGLPILLLLPSYSVWLCLLCAVPVLSIDLYIASVLSLGQGYFLLLLLFLALQWQYGKPYAAQTRMLHWAVIIFCFIYCLASHISTLDYWRSQMSFSGIILFITALYLFGHATSTATRINKLRWFAATYLAIVLLLSTQPYPGSNLFYLGLNDFTRLFSSYEGINILLAICLLALATWQFYRQKSVPKVPLAFTASIIMLTLLPLSAAVLAAVASLLIAVFALLFMYQGAQNNRLTITNFAFVWLSLLIMIKFMDSDISLTLKGMIFILLGGLLLILNLWLLKKRRVQ